MPTRTVDFDAEPVGPLGQAWMKLAWSQRHRETLNERLNAYRLQAEPPFTFRSKLDDDHRTWRAVVIGINPCPSSWALILGDFCHNARASLDYAAWELVRRGSNPTPVRPQDVGFPIGETKPQFESKRGTELPGVVQPNILTVLRIHHPYQLAATAHEHPFAVLCLDALAMRTSTDTCISPANTTPAIAE
jgi:hypothetical protein